MSLGGVDDSDLVVVQQIFFPVDDNQHLAVHYILKRKNSGSLRADVR